MMVNRLPAGINSRTINMVGAVLLAILFIGCSSPKVKFYTLSPTAVNALDTDKQLAIAIGPTEFPRELIRKQIVTRSSANQIKVNQTHVWSASLQLDFDRTLADNVATLLGSERVVPYPAQPRFAIDYRVLLDVRQFDGGLGDAVTLRGNWTAIDGAGDVVTVQKFSINQPTDGGSYDALVAAHSAAIGALSEQIANALIARPSAAD
jgi:uncharacterized lipoprotein YmbA